MDKETTILLIDTSLKEAFVGLCTNGSLIGAMHHPHQQEHSSFVQPAVKKLMASVGMELGSLAAVAVINGPGSYTGLRVGLSSAKGICFALNKPLILINTLEWMAYGNMDHGTDLVCPMIDARRMEVFTAVFDKKMNPVLSPTAMVLEETSFQELLDQKTMAFVGDGAEKWEKISQSTRAIFPGQKANAGHFAAMAHERLEQGKFDDLAYSEPFYTKAFFSTKTSSLH